MENGYSKKIPSLLFIEDTVYVSKQLADHPNVLVFNRSKPQIGLNEIKYQIQNAKKFVDIKNDENALGWVLGGAAALTIINLLSEKK